MSIWSWGDDDGKLEHDRCEWSKSWHSHASATVPAGSCRVATVTLIQRRLDNNNKETATRLPPLLLDLCVYIVEMVLMITSHQSCAQVVRGACGVHVTGWRLTVDHMVEDGFRVVSSLLVMSVCQRSQWFVSPGHLVVVAVVLPGGDGGGVGGSS